MNSACETPDAATTEFVPYPGVEVVYEESVDVAAAANAYAPFDLPSSLAGLMSRSGEDPARSASTAAGRPR